MAVEFCLRASFHARRVLLHAVKFTSYILYILLYVYANNIAYIYLLGSVKNINNRVYSSVFKPVICQSMLFIIMLLTL
jgi:hypothetical protein